MSVYVYIWDQHVDMYGHAALSINHSLYISWWPSKAEEGKGSLKGKSIIGSRAISSTMKNDRISEGNRIPSWVSAPIDGLDESSMEMWWYKKIGQKYCAPTGKKPSLTPSRYNVLSTSCSGVVFEALEVGKGFAKFPKAAAIATRAGSVITPINVKDIAAAMSGELGFWDTAKHAVPGDMRMMWNYGSKLFY